MELTPLEIQNLSLEIQLEILSRLNRGDLLNLCQVNTLWENICRDELLWKILVLQDFGDTNKFGNSWYDIYKTEYNKIRIFVEEIFNIYKLIGEKSKLIDLIISFIKRHRDFSSRIINITEWDNLIDNLYQLIVLNVNYSVSFRENKLLSDINHFLIIIYYPEINPEYPSPCIRCNSYNCQVSLSSYKGIWRFIINCPQCGVISSRYGIY
jgi:hypothetical protein